MLSFFQNVALAIVFADVFTNFADGVDSIGINTVVYWLLGLGFYAFLTMLVQSSFLETAAAEMSDTMKKEWFDALLRQDMAYYDLMDISGTATLINTNGKQFKRCEIMML